MGGPTAAAPGQDPNESVYVAANDGEIELAVGEPVLVKSGLTEHHAYPVTGRDSLGEIDVQRRFQNFYDFRHMLTVRFPGLYIPPVPGKTQLGMHSKDDSTVRERKYFLDLFLKECCSLRYLAQSKELQILLRPQGDISSLMSKQYKPKLPEVLAAYRATLPVVEDYQEREISVFAEDVNKFAAD